MLARFPPTLPSEKWHLLYNNTYFDSRIFYHECSFDAEWLKNQHKLFINAVNWTQTYRTNDRRRKPTAWFVTQDCTCNYSYSDTFVQHQLMPPWLHNLTQKVFSQLGITGSHSDLPNSCNINMYNTGCDSLGWHSDDEQRSDHV